MGDTAILRAYVLALLVAIVGVHVLELGLVESIPVRPFRWLANLTGGFVFGVGMILGGGCAGQLLVPPGRGRAGRVGRAGGVRDGRERGERRRPAVGADDAPDLRVRHRRPAGHPPRDPRASGRGWSSASSSSVLGVWLVRNRPEEGEHGKWRWPVTGSRHRPGHRARLVPLDAGRQPHRDHLRRQHRAPPDVPPGGLSQPGHLGHGADPRRRRWGRRWPRGEPGSSRGSPCRASRS